MVTNKFVKPITYLLLALLIHTLNSSSVYGTELQVGKTFRSTEEFLSYCVTTHRPDLCHQMLYMYKQDGTQIVEWFPSSFEKKTIVYKNELSTVCSDISIFSIGYLYNFIYDYTICNGR